MSSGTNDLIICGRNHRGKRLAYAILRGLRQHGVVSVAALSETGIEHIVKVGQTVANSMGTPVYADPERKEIEITPGVYRLALIMTWRVGTPPETTVDPDETVVDTTSDGVTFVADDPVDVIEFTADNAN